MLETFLGLTFIMDAGREHRDIDISRGRTQSELWTAFIVKVYRHAEALVSSKPSKQEHKEQREPAFRAIGMGIRDIISLTERALASLDAHGAKVLGFKQTPDPLELGDAIRKHANAHNTSAKKLYTYSIYRGVCSQVRKVFADCVIDRLDKLGEFAEELSVEEIEEQRESGDEEDGEGDGMADDSDYVTA